MVEPIRTWKVYIDMQEGKESDTEAAGRRTGRDRQSISRPAVRKEVEK